MPTPTGLPKKGDRVEALEWATRELQGRGEVVARGGGAFWSLTIRWDKGGTSTNVDAAWWWKQGLLRLEKPPAPITSLF